MLYCRLLLTLATQGYRTACPDGRVVLSVATDCSLSLITAWVWNPAGACKKVASDLGLGGGLRHQLQLVSHELARNMAEKVAKNEIPNRAT